MKSCVALPLVLGLLIPTACSSPAVSSSDAESGTAGSTDSGSGETGAGETGAGETDTEESGTEDTGEETGEETGAEETGEETGTEDTGEETGGMPLCPEPFSETGLPGIIELPPPFVTCALDSPCDVVVADESVSATTGSGDEIQNPDAVACVTQSLLDADMGEYAFDVTGLIAGDEIRLRLYAGGYLEWSVDSWVDSAGTITRTPGFLDSNYDFASCNGMSDWDDTWNCISQGFLPCEMWDEDAVLCPE